VAKPHFKLDSVLGYGYFDGVPVAVVSETSVAIRPDALDSTSDIEQHVEDHWRSTRLIAKTILS
jgi:hypothetical protein